MPSRSFKPRGTKTKTKPAANARRRKPTVKARFKGTKRSGY